MLQSLIGEAFITCPSAGLMALSFYVLRNTTGLPSNLIIGISAVLSFSVFLAIAHVIGNSTWSRRKSFFHTRSAPTAQAHMRMMDVNRQLDGS